jgi:hypothetical protein
MSFNGILRHSFQTLAAATVLTAASGVEAQYTDLTKLTAITLDLRVTSCNDPSRILMGGSGPAYYIETTAIDGTLSRQWVSVPETLFQPGQVDTLGFRPAGIVKLSDFERIRLGVLNADICIDKIELIANDFVVFDWTYEGGEHLIGSRYPISESWLDIVKDNLRPVIHRHGIPPAGDAICALPSGISSPALQRTIQGILGDAVFRSGGTVSTDADGNRTRINWAEYLPGDFTGLSRSGDGDGAIHVDTRFHAGTNWTAGSAFGVDADVMVSMSFDITPVCSDPDNDASTYNSVLGLSVSPVNVTKVEGSDFIMNAVIGIVSPEGQIGATVNAKLDELRGKLSSVVQGLPICPRFTVADDGSIETGVSPEFLLTVLGPDNIPTLCE